MTTISYQEKTRRDHPALMDGAAFRAALRDAFLKLAPRHLIRSPVMAVVMGGTLLSAVITLAGVAPAGFGWAVTAILFVTVLFGNFAEAVAEARGRGQAASLRRARKDLVARRVETALGGAETRIPAAELRPGDYVIVSAGEQIPADGEIIRGVATINESAVTGESAPVLREAGTDRSGVIGGTKVLSDEIVVKITAEPGHSFLDRMIALVEGANRQKTPNEIALTLLLAAMTLTFLIVVATLPAIGAFVGVKVDPLLLIALLVCLIPTTIGGLLPAIGIAGMNRALSANVLAKSGKAVEVAGDVDVLLLDKTGTITHGDRQATAFHPLAGIDKSQLRDAALLASLADPTPEGKSIVRLAREQGCTLDEPERATYLQFTAQTRMSGVDVDDRVIRKGAGDAIGQHVLAHGGNVPNELAARIEQVARGGATPLVVSEGRHVLGVVELSDVVKHGIKRQSADRRGHRRRGRRRRLHRRGQAGGQARPHPPRTGRWQAGGNGRRRHQRCAGAGAGRRGPGDELGHAGGQGSRQHGRSGFGSGQAAGGGRSRQAAADHARRADHLLARQRRVQVFRDPAGAVRRRTAADGRAQRDAPVQSRQRRAGRADLQRDHHPGADSTGAARRAFPPGHRHRAVAAEHADLRRGRRAAAVRGHQTDRHGAVPRDRRLRKTTCNLP
jgi:P-type E1-E2 ATPase